MNKEVTSTIDKKTKMTRALVNRKRKEKLFMKIQ
jgi:hypothetical protein